MVFIKDLAGHFYLGNDLTYTNKKSLKLPFIFLFKVNYIYIIL